MISIIAKPINRTKDVMFADTGMKPTVQSGDVALPCDDPDLRQ